MGAFEVVVRTWMLPTICRDEKTIIQIEHNATNTTFSYLGIHYMNISTQVALLFLLFFPLSALVHLYQ